MSWTHFVATHWWLWLLISFACGFGSLMATIIANNYRVNKATAKMYHVSLKQYYKLRKTIGYEPTSRIYEKADKDPIGMVICLPFAIGFFLVFLLSIGLNLWPYWRA